MKSDIFCLIRTDSSGERLIYMRFYFNEQKKQYEFSKEVPSVQNEQPALIVHGISSSKFDTEARANKFIEFFQEKGVYQIMMAGMADHPQYSGKKLAAIKESIFFDMGFDSTSASFINKFLLMKDFSRQFEYLPADARIFYSPYFLRLYYKSAKIY